MKYLIFTVFLFIFTACAEEDNIQNNIKPSVTDSIIDEINKEPVVIYKPADNIRVNTIHKNIPVKMYIDVPNIRNKNIYILIPETKDNKNNYIHINLEKHNDVCNQKICNISLCMIIGEQSLLNNNFLIYLPVTLLDETEFKKFIEINKEEKYKDAAMQYLLNRIYLQYTVTGKILE